MFQDVSDGINKQSCCTKPQRETFERDVARSAYSAPTGRIYRPAASASSTLTPRRRPRGSRRSAVPRRSSTAMKSAIDSSAGAAAYARPWPAGHPLGRGREDAGNRPGARAVYVGEDPGRAMPREPEEADPQATPRRRTPPVAHGPGAIPEAVDRGRRRDGGVTLGAAPVARAS